MAKNKKITIIDVAKLAGVSKGTVDRVVHNRGEVSIKSTEKVKQVIKELGYEPNLYASMLATKKEITIACLIPEFAKGEYWEKIHLGILEGREDSGQFNVDVREFLYNQYNSDSFKKACKELLNSNPSGVVLPPLFKNDTHAFTNILSEREIPYVYVDSKLEDNSYFAYFGMPMYQSGYLCAHLLTERCPEKEVDKVAIIRIMRDKTRQSDPTINRRAGFMDYMSEHFPEAEIHNVFINPNDQKETYSTLDTFFKENPSIKFVVMFNSRIHLIAKYLTKNIVEGRRVIGFDDLEKNIEALNSGVVSILIAQHTKEQTHQAIKSLVDYLVMHKKPSKKDNYMHMDILTDLNIDYY